MKIGLSGERDMFEVISGFTITEEFNETLDSADIKIRTNHRLNIKPYDECCFENGKCFLVDTFIERQETLDIESYIYTISLMSLTKLLEKIQLPNLAITHSLVSGQTVIYTYINRYLDLYVPKIKMKTESGWEYKQLIVNKLKLGDYNAVCRDLTFSKPTLRQALTTLMLQVGRIPTLIKNQETGEIELHDIDFRAKGDNIAQLDNYCNYIMRSNSSDSYVNVLKTVSENVLDDENVVISETLGFRDKDNVFIKQDENLKLNTRFPIYSVNKFSLVLLGKGVLTIKADTPFLNEDIYIGLATNENYIGVSSAEIAGIVFKDIFDYYKDILLVGDLYLYELVEQNTEYTIKRFVEKVSINKTISSTDNVLANNPFENAYQLGGVFVGKIYATNITTNQEISGKCVIATAPVGISITATNLFRMGNIYYPFETDITKLCVENSKRQLLDTNFLEMEDVSNINELSQYIYGTVGYSIGSTEIFGFSQKYDVVVGWWSEPSHLYIENLINMVSKFPQTHQIVFYDDYSGLQKDEIFAKSLGNIPLDIGYICGFHFEKHTDYKNFASLTFNIEYNPLNNLNITHSKEEEINIPIEQYDSSDNAVTNFNDIVEVEQQKVNRLGNDVITINQRIPLSENKTGYNLNDRVLGEYIIFKKETQYKPHEIQIVYTASKDYVLQNFFTAIQTKYRAYEYVNFGQSVLRQENKTIYALIDRFYFDGDDNIRWGNLDTGNLKFDYKFISGVLNEYNFNSRLISAGIGYNNKYYRNDLSIVKSKNNISFTTQMYDSVSYGQKLIPSTETEQALGGYEQEWYIVDTFASTTLFLSNTNGIDLTDMVKETSVSTTREKMFNLPYMSNIGTYNNQYGEETYNYELIVFVNDNKTNSDFYTYFLDQQEKLNQTLQFEFYTTDSGIKWTEKLWELCNLVCNKPKGEKFIYIGVDEEFGINEKAYRSIDASKLISYDNTQISAFSGLSLQANGGITINWNEIASAVDFIKIVYKENGYYYDLFAVERIGNNESDNIYITLNDTKSLKVGSQRNGCLTFTEYQVAKNTLNRSVEKL